MSEHGTIPGYKAGCRCDSCRVANAAYQRAYRDGRRTKVRAAPCRDYLRTLMDSGMTMANIARLSDLDSDTIRGVRSGLYKTVCPETADKLMGVAVGSIPSGGLVDATPTRILVAAMHGAGFTDGDISAMLGTKLDFSRPDRFRARTWLRIRTLYHLMATNGIVPASVLEEIT